MKSDIGILQEAVDKAFTSQVKVKRGPGNKFYIVNLLGAAQCSFYNINQLKVFLEGVLIGRKEELIWIKKELGA
jgi:hypothetical protein